jgi:hypothetical protein
LNKIPIAIVGYVFFKTPTTFLGVYTSEMRRLLHRLTAKYNGK